MSDFKNILIEKYKGHFIKQNPQLTTDNEETIAFCNKQLKLFYEPYIAYLDARKINSELIEKQLYDLIASDNNNQMERINLICFLCLNTIFNENTSLKKFTNELAGFDEIRFYFDLGEFEHSVIPFLEYEINTSIVDLITAIEYNRQLKLTDVVFRTLNTNRNTVKKNIFNLKEKRRYNAKKPRKKLENELEIEKLEENTIDKFNVDNDEFTETLYKENRSVVKSERSMMIVKNILNQIIESNKTKIGFSKSKLFASIQSYIFLLFDNNQLGIKTKAAFDESNCKTIKEEYEFNYKKYYNNRIRSLIFKL